MDRQGLHVKIEGRVQGVGYRAWAAHNACRLGLRGWVRNRRDGSVEMVITGEEGRVETMLQRCEIGPLNARVTCVHVIGVETTSFSAFDVKPTT